MDKHFLKRLISGALALVLLLGMVPRSGLPAWAAEECSSHSYDDGVCMLCGKSVLGSDWLIPEFAQGEYSMVVLPDTQNMVQYWPEEYYRQMQWIADSKERLNIRAVLHMGDMVNTNNDNQWTVCENGTDILEEAGIPWMPMMGNHDDSGWFNRYYDYSTYGTDQSWFGGSYHVDKLDHTYWFVNQGNREYLILSLGWAPSWDVLAWAQGIVEANPDKNVILACHAYMNKDGTLLSQGDAHCVTSYLPGYPNGDDVWEAFKGYENVVLAMGGHIHSPDMVTYSDLNGTGREVTSLLIDRQNDDTGSRLGMVAVLTFHSGSNQVDVNWYSTYYDALYRQKNQFAISVPHVCDHQYSATEIVPTCTLGGGIRYSCSLCGHFYLEEATEALGHSYETQVVDPTCVETGYTADVCSVCGHVEYHRIADDLTELFKWNEGKVISAINGTMQADRNWTASDYVDISGYTSIEIVTADSVNADTTRGVAFYDADKNYISGVVHTDKTGSEYGMLVHDLQIPQNAVYVRSTWYSVNHDKYNGAELHEFYCLGYTTEIPALGHDYETKVVEPTCAEQGYSVSVCKRCGENSLITREQTITDRFSWTQGQMIIATTGKATAYDAWCASDYVDVSGYESIKILMSNTASTTTSTGLAFYDVNKNYVSGVIHSDGSGVYGVREQVLEIPENVVYVRSTWYADSNAIYNPDWGAFYCIGTESCFVEPTGDHVYEYGICTVCGESDPEWNYTHAVPESEGVANAIRRAYALTDVEWTPLADVPGVKKINGEFTVVPFEAGVTYRGIPYSGTTSTDTYVGLNVSLQSFLTALENVNSVLYTENLFSTNPKSATYFGTVCSKFAQYVLDVPGSYNTNNVANIPGMETLALPGKYTVDQIKLGDVILDVVNHTAVCTDILYDEEGNVAFIEISEAVLPLVRRKYWTVEEFYDHFDSYRLCRYAYIDQTPALPETNLEDSYALMPRFGDKYNYKVSSTKGIVDVLEQGYARAVILRDGQLIQTIELNGAASFKFDRSVPGHLEMYLEKADGTRSGSVYAQVVRSSLTVTDASSFLGGKLTVSYQGSSGVPLYVQLGSGQNMFCALEPDQTDGATITFRTGQLSGESIRARVAFQNEYGIYLSAWTTFTVDYSAGTGPNPSSDPLISQAIYWEGHNITPSNHLPVIQENKPGYWSYTMIPVAENTTYYSEGATRMWYLDDSGNPISTYNAYKDGPVSFQFTTPAGTAYVNIAYSSIFLSPGQEQMTHLHNYQEGICTECGEEESLLPQGWQSVPITNEENHASLAYKLENGVLTFHDFGDPQAEGYGVMPSYTNTTPAREDNYGITFWYQNRSGITKVVFDETISVIGSYTLTNMDDLEEICIQNPEAQLRRDLCLFSTTNRPEPLRIYAATTVSTVESWIRGNGNRKITAAISDVVLYYTDLEAVSAQLKELETELKTGQNVDAYTLWQALRLLGEIPDYRYNLSDYRCAVPGAEEILDLLKQLSTGTCGEGVTYRLAAMEQEGMLHLHINGSGAMEAYADPAQAPWDEVLDTISYVTVDELVTGLDARVLPASATYHVKLNSEAGALAKAKGWSMQLDTLRILLIGNSHTADYSEFFRNILEDLKNAGMETQISVTRTIIGSTGLYSGRISKTNPTYTSHLEYLENSAGAYSNLASKRFDLVIVQDYMESIIDTPEVFAAGLSSVIQRIKTIAAENGQGTPEIAWFADWVDIRTTGGDSSLYDAQGNRIQLPKRTRQEVYDHSLTNISHIQTLIEAGAENMPDFVIRAVTIKQNAMSSYLGTTVMADNSSYCLLERDTTHMTCELGRYLMGAGVCEEVLGHYRNVLNLLDPDITVADALSVENGPAATGTGSQYTGSINEEILAVIREAISSPQAFRQSVYVTDPVQTLLEEIGNLDWDLTGISDQASAVASVTEQIRAQYGQLLTVNVEMAEYISAGEFSVTVEIGYGYSSARSTISLGEHTHRYESTVTAPTCTEEGYTTHTCTRCGESYVDFRTAALGHNMSQWAVTVAPGCETAGQEHTECVREGCGYQEDREVPALGHSYASEVTAPTCTEQGYTTHTCIRCGDSFTDTPTEPTDHSFSPWQISREPAYNREGEETRNCVKCSHVEFRPVSVTVVTSGNFGGGTTPSDKVTYTLYSDGTMVVEGTGAIFNCAWNGAYQPFIDYRKQIKHLIIGEGITQTTGGCFAYLSNLETVQFPSTLKKLLNNAFMSSFAESVTEITIPAAVTQLGDYTIGHYTGDASAYFTDVIIENPDITITDSNAVFNGGSRLDKLTLYSYGASNNVSTYALKYGIRYIDLNDYLTGQYQGLEYTCSGGILELRPLEENAVIAAENQPWAAKIGTIEHIVLAEGITGIAAGAFRDYPALKSVQLPNSLQTIGDNAFALTESGGEPLEMAIPRRVQQLGRNLFAGRQNVAITGYRGSPAENLDEPNVVLTLKKVFKLLLIGNSYSEDASNGSHTTTSQLFDILQAMLGPDTEVTLALLSSGGKGIHWHATQAEQDNRVYSFKVITTETPTWKSLGAHTSSDALAWTDWDAVSLQPYNVNVSTGMESVPYPESTDEKFYPLETAAEFMLDHIGTYAPYAEIYFYMHWAQTKSMTLNAVKGNYERMAAFMPQVLDYAGQRTGKQFADIIPVGQAVQNARTTYLALLRYNITAYDEGNLNLVTDAQIGLQRDGGHLSFNIGRYLAALTFAEIIVPEEQRAEGYVIPEIRVTESVGKLPREYTEIVQKAVAAAVESWRGGSLAVTDIEGYLVDPADTAAEALTEAVIPVCGGDRTETIRQSVLNLLPVDFAVDAVTENAETQTAEVSIRFGYTSRTVTVAITVGDHSYQNGTCTICGEADPSYHIPGDITGDGVVNNKDLIRLFRHLSGYEVEVVEAALDVTGDGAVNNKDLIRLFRYLSAYDVEIH